MEYSIDTLSGKEKAHLLSFTKLLIKHQPISPADMMICTLYDYDDLKNAVAAIENGETAFQADVVPSVIGLAIGMWHRIETSSVFDKFKIEELRQLYYKMRGEDTPPTQSRIKNRNEHLTINEMLRRRQQRFKNKE